MSVMDPQNTFQVIRFNVMSDGVAVMRLARGTVGNAVTLEMLDEVKAVLSTCDADDRVKVLILMAEGKNFCAGLDFATMQVVTRETLGVSETCPAVARERFRKVVLAMQEAITALERCTKPIIAAVQGACVGAGVDMISACDIRLCTEDASFCVKEVDVGITADLGTLQRLPYIIGEGRARDLALTARTICGKTALQYGLVTQTCQTVLQLPDAAMSLARTVASKPSLAVRGTKQVMLYGRGRSVEESLQHVALWNAAFLWSSELQTILQTVQQRQASRTAPRTRAKL